MVQFVWEFLVRENCIAEFERHYSSKGSWAQLFERGAGFRGTALLRDVKRRGRYLTVDSWENQDAQRAMRERFAREYEELDRVCEQYTEQETNLGTFEVE